MTSRTIIDIDILKKFLAFLLVSFVLLAQSLAQKPKPTSRVIVGKVFDSETSEPIPFANVYVKGTSFGTVTDFDGLFSIKVPLTADSLTFKDLGYRQYVADLSALNADTNIVRLTSLTISLNEIKVKPDEAPRRLIKNVVAHKRVNNPDRHNKVSFEKYCKWEYSLNNISDKAKESWMLKGANALMRTDGDSSRSLPVYFSEQLSFNEVQREPQKMKSTIIADKTVGLDVFKQYEIGGFSSALDMQISFYDNVVRLLGVGFVSPIADNALSYYKYYITDSTLTSDSTKIYTVKFKPKKEGDIVFEGFMHIDNKKFSLLDVAADMPKYTNLNFVKKLHLESSYQTVADSLPFYGTNMVEAHVDYMPVNSDKKRLEIYCRMFNSSEKVRINPPEPIELSAKALTFETYKNPGYANQDTAFWNNRRHEKLSQEDLKSTLSIDSLNNVGTVKAFNLAAKMGITGFLDLGTYELGPVMQFVNFNKVEGVHLGVGARTSKEISENWTLLGVVGYGFKNSRPTLQTEVGYRFDHHFLRTVKLSYYDRLVKIGENENILNLYENMITTSENNFVSMIFQREAVDELMYERKLKGEYTHEWFDGFSSKLKVQGLWQYSAPYYPFTQNGNPIDRVDQQEISIDSRLSFKEKYIEDGIQRFYMSTRYPILHFLVGGGRSAAGSNESFYARIHTSLKHSAFWGQTELQYAVEGGVIFGKLPYTQLELPRGNKTYGLYRYDFNMLDYLEFVNDKYLYVYADYFLNGRILHLFPRVNRLGLREVIGFKAMLGSMSDKHKSMLDMPTSLSGLNGGYLELNAGMDNIFRFFRIDAVWRVTNATSTGAPTFGLRAQFNLKF